MRPAWCSCWVQTYSKYIKLGAIFDAAPDLWGRRVIQAAGDFSSSDERQMLLMGRGNGVSALLFADTPEFDRDGLPGIESLPLLDRDLIKIHEAAHKVCLRTPADQNGVDGAAKSFQGNDAFGWLTGSWSMGGARAKAVVRDVDNRLYIAKFSEPHDQYDRQRIEWANLLMARDIGLQVPDCKVIDTYLGSVFVIERFDRKVVGSEASLNAHTLLSPHTQGALQRPHMRRMH